MVRPLFAGPGTRAVEYAGKVHHRVAPGGQLRERVRIESVDLHHVYRRQEDQVLGALAAARGNRDACTARGERGHQVPADKTGTSDDQNVLVFQGSSSLTRSVDILAGIWPSRSFSGISLPPINCE